MMKKLATAVLLVALAACGDDEGDDGSATARPDSEEVIDPLAEVPTCEDWTTRAVPASEWADGCRTGSVDDGTLTLAGSTTRECADGRTLHWNDAVWGYGDEPAVAHEPGAEQVAPEAERTACEP